MNFIKKIAEQVRLKKLQSIYILYWILLTYIIAALIFWLLALTGQVQELTRYRLDLIDVNDLHFAERQAAVAKFHHRKITQYIAEGITFLLLIITGAVIVFRAIRRQFHQSQQHQNFMMAITHELKTPIAVTKLNLETMQKRPLQPEQQRKLISTTIQEADRLNGLCNNLLLNSQLEVGGYRLTKEKMNLSDLAANATRDFSVRFPQRKILLDSEGDVFVDGDSILLSLVVNNLLDNAIKYSGREDLVLIKVFKRASVARLQVVDEGPGIEASLFQKVFEKYYRGKNRQTKGTGLGLYLSKKIVRQHKGHIEIAANSPRGTIFTVTLQTIT